VETKDCSAAVARAMQRVSVLNAWMAAAGNAAEGHLRTAVAANAMTGGRTDAATVKFMTAKLKHAVTILFSEVNINAVEPVVEANAVLRARPAVILVSQVEHVMTLPLKSVVLEAMEAMTLYATLTKFAVIMDRVPSRAKK
jgi:hypothetical protein